MTKSTEMRGSYRLGGARKHTLSSVIAILTTAMLGIGAAPAMADTRTAVDEQVVSEASEFLQAYGADAETQDRLIAAYLAGETWDSFSSSSTPISVENTNETDGDYTVSTFMDGSISVVRIESPVDVGAGEIQPMGISGCSVSGNVHSNCKIDMWVGVVSMSFYATYNLGNNTVTNAYGGGWTIGGACSSSGTLTRPVSNIALMTVQAQMCVVGYTTWFELRLTISGGSAKVSWV